MIKERPILFSGPMIRAILAGRKTQTRRVMNPQPNTIRWSPVQCGRYDGWEDEHGQAYPCPYGQPGDRLYVKEATWMFCEKRPNGKTKAGRPKWHYVPLKTAPVIYVADGKGKPIASVEHPETGNEWCWKYKTGRFMPRWASRITLEITDIRVQRLQKISEEDAIAEGALVFPERRLVPAREAFADLWDSINGKHSGCSWGENPFVWTVSFKRVQP